MAEKDVVAEGLVTGAADNPKPATGDNPQSTSDWAKDFDEGLKKKVEKFKTPKDLATGYVELETYSSKTLQDMTPEQQDRFLKRLGLPEKPEEYELSGLTLPDGLPRSATADADFKVLVHSLKLTKDQARGLHEYSMKKVTENIVASRAAAKKQAEDSESALRTSWGTSHDANNAAVDKVIRLGGDKFVQAMNDGPGKDAVIREGFYAISKQMADETLVSGRVEGRQKKELPKGMLFDPSISPELLR